MTVDIVEYRKQLMDYREDIRKFIDRMNCNPIIVRLAWHDSGTYDKSVPDTEWPSAGGANGSIVNEVELDHKANAGLDKAVRYLKPFKKKYSLLSFADIIQLASAEAIQLAGGPEIDMIYGRLDSTVSPNEGNLPDGNKPFGDGSKSAAEHLRRIFYRMGFIDQEIVALSGGHTLGRAFKERSGTTDYGYGKKKATMYTNGDYIARKDGEEGVGMLGGISWTKKWLTFDNSYFKDQLSGDKSLIVLDTDRSVAQDEGFKSWFELYASDEKKFFEDYAAAHKKLSELGSKFFTPGGIKLKSSKL